jgi:hypothetical protein
VEILGSIHPQLAGMNRAAQKVGDVSIRAAKSEEGKATDSVDLISAERSFQVSVKAIQAGLQTTGILLDVKT